MNDAQTEAERQVLINTGNRFVVFGPPTGLPNRPAFDPNELEVLPSVAEESEAAPQRIVDTLRVTGLTRVKPNPKEFGWDIEFQDEAGRALYVEVKTRAGSIRSAEFSRAFRRASDEAKEGRRYETWFFDIDRPSLTVVGEPGLRGEQRWQVLSVWEKTSKSLFAREDVQRSVEEWAQAIEGLYSFVQKTFVDTELRLDAARRYPMSEELMQRFAVADRELPILDVLRGEEVVASFIPRALWVIGSFGRVDLVTQVGTTLLVRRERGDGFSWHWVEQDDRRRIHPLDAATLRMLIA